MKAVQKAGKKAMPKVGKKLGKVGRNKKLQKYSKKLFRKAAKKGAKELVKHVAEREGLTKEDALMLGMEQVEQLPDRIRDQLKDKEEVEAAEIPFPPLGICPVCCEENPIVSLKCTHEICIGCGQKYLQEQIEILQEVVFPCPSDVNCKEYMDHNLVMEFLSRSEYAYYFHGVPTRMGLSSLRNQYDYLSTAEALHREEEMVWCPDPDCHWGGLRGPRRGMCPEIECPSCSTHFCSLCQTPAHPGEACRFRGDAALLYRKWVKKCPACQTPQARASDMTYCNFVRCGDVECGCRFCFCCGEKVSTRRHFTQPRTVYKCRLGVQDIFLGLWPLRLFMDFPFFVHWFIWFFLMPPTVVSVFFYIWWSFPIWWAKKLWHKQKKWGWPSCIRVFLCIPTFCGLWFYGIILGWVGSMATLALLNIYCILNCPCIPLSGSIKTTLCVLECLFSCLGMFPEFAELAKQIRDQMEELRDEEFLEAGESLDEEEEDTRETEETEETIPMESVDRPTTTVTTEEEATIFVPEETTNKITDTQLPTGTLPVLIELDETEQSLSTQLHIHHPSFHSQIQMQQSLPAQIQMEQSLPSPKQSQMRTAIPLTHHTLY